jgi:hypothetical protein
MSTIWTPGGEYVPKTSPPQEEPQHAPPPTGPGGPGGQPEGGERRPSPEEMEAAQAEVRAILATPVVDQVAAHAMGLFELAALHLERQAATGEAPDLAEASLAADAMAALVEGLGERLGKYRASLADALAQVRLAYVRASSQ